MNLRFEKRAPRTQAPRPAKAFDRWLLANGEETSLFYREADDYLVRFPDVADFNISLNKQIVICWPAPGVSDCEITHQYLNQILPLVMGFNGDFVLHASAVAVGGNAIAFLGPSGRGKSTLAAAFANAGHPFLTDDALILDHDGDGYVVRPRAPQLRLCPDAEAAILRKSEQVADAENHKSLVSAGSEFAFHDEPCSLGAIYVLSEPRSVDRPRVNPISRPEALSKLLQHSFILDVEDRRLVSSLFDRLVSVVANVDCFELDYPRNFAALPSLLEAVIGHVNEEVLGL